MRNLEWFEGAPDKLEPGMMVFVGGQLNKGLMIGHVDAAGGTSLSSPDERIHIPRDMKPLILRWAWVIKPHEQEWAADIAGKHAKGRPEQ